jgi:hypothetical protein
MSGSKLDAAELARLAGMAAEAYAISSGLPWAPGGPAVWQGVVTALLADPAVLAAAWRAGAEAMREAAVATCRAQGDAYSANAVAAPIESRGVYLDGASYAAAVLATDIAALPLPTYPGGAKGGEEG